MLSVLRFRIQSPLSNYHFFCEAEVIGHVAPDLPEDGFPDDPKDEEPQDPKGKSKATDGRRKSTSASSSRPSKALCVKWVATSFDFQISAILLRMTEEKGIWTAPFLLVLSMLVIEVVAQRDGYMGWTTWNILPGCHNLLGVFSCCRPLCSLFISGLTPC